MYNICENCKKRYIEEDEDVCVECDVYFNDENDYIGKYVDEVDGDTLNDLGASLSEKDY